jgi:hypothetical protein
VEAQINSGIKMENAYTAMPYTTWVGRAMFTGENPVSGHLYAKDSIGEKEGEYPLYDYLKNQGYYVYHSCMGFRGATMFGREARREPDIKHPIGVSTRYQWFGICELLKRKGRTFVILHSLAETHPPYLCMSMDYIDWREWYLKSEESKTANKKFLDDRIKWYSRFYGDRTRKVWMSDHGHCKVTLDFKKRILGNVCIFAEERTHVFFGISGGGIKKKSESRYFQFDDFMLLIKYLHGKNEDDYEKMFKPYVVYENYALYNKKNVDEIVNDMSVEEMEMSKSDWQQFLGVRDDKYLYILYYDGSESFYVLPDEETNELENPAYAEPLAKFRLLVDGKKFINIFEEEKFVHSRKMYEKVGVAEHIW